jgi:phospho-N-acetylmuramoyl-pentapeptide-transferase
MLYSLYNLSEYSGFFNLFRYITFRGAGALLTSLLLTLIFIPILIKILIEYKAGQPIRDLMMDNHKSKQGTPTMGGLAIIAVVILSSLIWGDLSNPYLWIVFFVAISFGILGFLDDFLKIKKSNSKGVSAKFKFLVQIIVSIIACLWINYLSPPEFKQVLAFPFFKDFTINLGLFYVVFVTIVLVGSSNAVNLTDGLDGLAIVPIAIVAFCLGLIVYLVGSLKFANYLQLHYIANSAELAVFCASIVGASIGFLWYNAPPAQIFMGDTGSLSLGGALGIISVIAKHEIVLAIIGGLFVMEAASVIIQVYYFKLSGGKRIFKMAPLHHHFEKCGWSESKVVIRFWIISIIFAIIGLTTLKFR